MEEILKIVLNSEILSEETKAQLTEHVQTLEKTLRESIETEVRAELAEKWVQERDALASKMETFVSESLTQELTELRDDIKQFRDLEKEFEEKIVERSQLMAEEVVAEKHRLQEALESEIESLVDKIDEFLELRLTEELSELAEDIQEVKDIRFGAEIFETFAGQFMRSHLSKSGVIKELEEAKAKVEELSTQLNESTKTQDVLIREAKVNALLSNLTGSKREQMAILLKGVATERLDETYKQFVVRIVKEDPVVDAIVESKTEQPQTTLKTGDSVMITESKGMSEGQAFRLELQRLAGITK
jgi:DNA repair exonuclease SbcCD ATPase subunit